MSEATQQAAEFLENVFDMTGLQLRVKVKQAVSGEVLDIEGRDAELLKRRPANYSKQHSIWINQVFGRSLAGGERLVCDVHGFSDA